MSQPAHDLMESAILDDEAASPSITPVTPPRRDSMEDADSSLTRKRPRLDNGTASKRGAMAVAPSPDTNTDNPPPADQLVEMTIRSPPPSSSTSSSQPAVDADGPVPAMDGAEEEGATIVTTNTTEPELEADDDTGAGSPTIEEVDEVEEEAMDYMRDPEDHFRQFPYANTNPSYYAALERMVTHFHGAGPLEKQLLQEVTLWLDTLPDHPSHWKGYYVDKALFWEQFALFVHKVLVRRHSFGDGFGVDEQGPDEIFYDFFRSYLALCARLLRVDASVISNCPDDGLVEQQILSYKHLRQLHTILRPDKSPVFHILSREYGTDLSQMGLRLFNDFVEAPVNGHEHLFAFTEAVCNKVCAHEKSYIALFVTQLWSTMGRYLCELPGLEVIDRPRFYRNVLQYFRSYNVDLQAPGKVVDVGIARDLLFHFATLLTELCQWDDAIASELAKEMLPLGRPSDNGATDSRFLPFSQDLANRPTLVGNAWKFKLLKKYVVKGRMELRVTSIGAMDSALVDIWKEYNNAGQGDLHPVMQYLAEFLLHEQVIDYIISVDSHPQLITRSGNIVGFLVVTRLYSERQTDAIWHTVAHSQDPRVVSATLTMMRTIINLMDSAELLYLCTKLYSLPIESYGLETLRFLSEVSDKLRLKFDDEWSNVDHKARPWSVAIRIMRDTSPSKESTKLTMNLHHEACELLRQMCDNIGIEERHRIYSECATHIANRSPKATGSVRAVLILSSQQENRLLLTNREGHFFEQHPDITRTILEELCAFVQTDYQQGPLYQEALEVRLDLLRFLGMWAAEAIPIDLYRDIWDHVVGKYAMSNAMRDRAWPRFSEIVKRQPSNEFCKHLITSYVPELEPEYYTAGMFHFVASYNFPTTRQVIATDEGDKELLQIRGADLLWRMVLDAPEGTIEDQAAKLLASRYVEVGGDLDVTLEEVEDAHIALVQKCTAELLSAYQNLRSGTNERSGEAEENMDVVLSDSARQQTELRFCRILLFEKLLLVTIRTKPEFSRPTDSDLLVVPPEPVIPNAIEIKYTTTHGSGKRALFISAESTVQDLETRICNAIGFTSVRLFNRGRKLNTPENAQEKLANLDLTRDRYILVQTVAGSEMRQPVPDNQAGCSVFETTVMDHFEELFAWMDSDDQISAVLFDFLSNFPYRERVADDVASGKASTDELFPPGKVFQANYAANALQHRLKEQLQKSTLDESFLLNAIQLLAKAILNPELMSDSFSNHHELMIASALVSVLLEFLKERPQQDISSRYFTDEARLVDRLMKILYAGLQVKTQDWTMAIWHSYATILEASLHSRAVWDAFMSRPDITALHQSLLLDDSRKNLREHIAKSIASVCGGDLPATSPVPSADTAAGFWKIISAVLPEAVRYPTQSEQLFEIAEQVFRWYDETCRDENYLRSCLVAWSDLLLNYRHEEFVGRDEVDFVVLGFTKLLLSCIPSIKSFKKPLNAGRLMEQIFQKFLFAPQIIEIDAEDSPTTGLPVLESSTRKELYDLMLALAEDGSSFGKLLSLAGSLAADEASMSSMPYGIERSNEIRSSTGYVGLLNPRAICYLNSLVTQLFMNVNFRKFMLGLEVKDSGASQRLLSETQTLFAQMQNSFRKSADPRSFATCVKGVEGLPIDVNIQMDADEFYNLLFDQWEGQMLSPETKQQFRSFYGGQTVMQIKSKECEHVSERVESFFVIQCDVQGKANLQESLQAFVEGDVMEGDNKYKCESCGGKFVDAVKRTCLKDVGDNLIFHLKRFDFDLVDMKRAKINDHFEFPEHIDVSLYNVDHLSDPAKPRQEDIFDLVGVLIHQGTSENGHYYSHIRERPSPTGGQRDWVEFNDRDVEKFDHTTIPYHAFGGWYDEQFQTQQKQFSAYMLFYQRRAAIEKDHDDYISSPSGGPTKVPIPHSLEARINADNESFVREYSLHDPNHSKFVRQILATLRTVNHGTCSEDHQQETKALRIVLNHLCQTISRQRNIEYFEETIVQLRKTVLQCPTCCHIGLKFLANHDSALAGLFLRCPHMKVRSQVRAFLADSLRYLHDKDPSLYAFLDSPDSDMENPVSAQLSGHSALGDIVQRLSLVTEELNRSARGWDDFFLTLCQIGRMGRLEIKVLLNHGILECCLKILSMHSQPSFRAQDPDLAHLVEKKRGIYNRLIELVYVLISNVDLGLEPVYPMERVHYDGTIRKFPLTQFEQNCLFKWDDHTGALAVLDKTIELFDSSKTDIYYPGEILKWMLQGHHDRLQQNIYYTVEEGISGLHPGYSDPYLRAAIPYCETCTVCRCILGVMDSVVKSASKLRDTGGKAHLDFLNSLLTLRNEGITDVQSPDFFYEYLLQNAKSYLPSLLVYEEEPVRRGAATHLESMYTASERDMSPTTLKLKYTSIRRLATELIKRIITEHDARSSRSFMQPTIASCQYLISLLNYNAISADPDRQLLVSAHDTIIFTRWENDVEPRLRGWLPDDGTPISGGELDSEMIVAALTDLDSEAFDQSDYASDSDDALEGVEGVEGVDVEI